MLRVALLYAFMLTALAERVADDWIDPFDMLNQEPSARERESVETSNSPNVPTKSRESRSQEAILTERSQHGREIAELQRQIEEQKKKIDTMSQQPTCTPVFRRFLSRLLKELKRFDLHSDSSDVLYDAKIKLSRQSITEIEGLLEGKESWRTGALDNAISQILVDIRPHNSEVWRWRFEDTFGVDLDTLIKLGLLISIMVATIATELWSKVSWFLQIGRVCAVGFIMSIIWNWFYLYKIAFAEQQKKMASLDGIGEQCTGIKKIEWTASLKEWFRRTWTLQDDPCQQYYEVLFVNPLLLVPPTKAISVTIVTFITEPMKHVGEGISDFIRALLKDLPFTLQLPVFVLGAFLLVILVYTSVHGAFQYGVLAPFRRPPRDPPPPQLQQPPRQFHEIEEGDHLAGGDGPQCGPRHQAADRQQHKNRVYRRRPNAQREAAAPFVVETLRRADRPYTDDEMDSVRPDTEQNLSGISDPENQEETLEEPAGARVQDTPGPTAQMNNKAAKSDSDPSERKQQKVKKSPAKDKRSRAGGTLEPLAEGQSARADVQEVKVSAKDGTSSDSHAHIETLGVPVQESSAAS
ncbi:chloride channel CLIC-like protein 1 isoform X2 [Nelusetta ayraudi]|uniref:chloride channel CLIC-like protein 1 isoform X2 n=1 Tax=Nelusetta ayraudi TaxID=303726 RepID=UPI003F72DFFA